MKAVLLYYSLNGSTKAEAQKIADGTDTAVCEVKEAKKRSFIAAFIPGGFQAMKRKAPKILPLGCDLNGYDRIIIGCPIWANFPAPAFNAVVELLPKGKDVELYFCSGSGSSEKSREGTKAMIEAKGCKLISYRDIKTGKIK